MKKTGLGIMMLMILLFSAVNTTIAEPKAAKKDGKVEIQTETMTVTIEGNQNVPKYDFGPSDNTSDRYSIQFTRIFEGIDENGDGRYDQNVDKSVAGTNNALAAYNWDFSDIIIESADAVTQKIHFNITGDGNDVFLQFRNHIDVDTPSELKFDVVIDNYEFTDPSAMFVLAFKLKVPKPDNISNQTVSGNTTAVQEESVNFDGGFFGSENAAEVNGTAVRARMSTGLESGANMLYLSYDYFEGRLVHDPTIGLDDDYNAGYLDAPVISMILASIFIPIIVLRKKRSQ